MTGRIGAALRRTPITPEPGEDMTQYDPILLAVSIRAPRVSIPTPVVSPAAKTATRKHRGAGILFGKRDKRQRAEA